MRLIPKGYEPSDARRILNDLHNAGIDCNALLMSGIAGRGNYQVNAKATAELLNDCKPRVVALLSTSVSPGASLEAMRDAGEFIESTEREQI